MSGIEVWEVSLRLALGAARDFAPSSSSPDAQGGCLVVLGVLEKEDRRVSGACRGSMSSAAEGICYVPQPV